MTLAGLTGVRAAGLVELIRALAGRRLTVAVAESLTGGLLTAVLTEVPGASTVVRGGLVVYATDLKHSVARVDEKLLAARGPVDPDVAVALAEGARETCGADIGIGLTGVAGPDPQDGIPVGTWFVAVATRSGSAVRYGTGLAARADAGAARAAIRAETVRAALAELGAIAGIGPGDLLTGNIPGARHVFAKGEAVHPLVAGVVRGSVSHDQPTA